MKNACAAVQPSAAHGSLRVASPVHVRRAQVRHGVGELCRIRRYMLVVLLLCGKRERERERERERGREGQATRRFDLLCG